MTTVHAYTNDQRILDLPHRDLRRARPAAVRMIPTTTGAATSVGLVLTPLQGKLEGLAIRVPTPNVSVVDFVAAVERETSKTELNEAFCPGSQSPGVSLPWEAWCGGEITGSLGARLHPGERSGVMRQRANPAVIGGFIVGAVALIVIGLLVFGRGGFLTEQRTSVLYFEDAVEGLSVGAPVTFQGVRIGSVRDIQVQYLPREGEFRVPVFIDLEPGRVKEVGVGDQPREGEAFLTSLIERGLRAQLQLQSLVTGQLFVQLGFHPDTPVRLVGAAGEVPEIPTIPTALAQASAAAKSLLERLEQLPLDQLFAHLLRTVQGLDHLVNAPEVFAAVRSLAHTLATTQQLLSRVDGQMPEILDEVDGTVATTHGLLTDLRQLVRHVDGHVTPLADGVQETLGTARATLRDGQQFLRHVDGRVTRLADSLADTSDTARGTLVQAQRRLDQQLGDALQDVSAAARAVRVLADYLERNPNALLFGKGGDRR
jgi:paraquat-inducible protein B